MGFLIFLIWLVGVFVAVRVFSHRAGLGVMGMPPLDGRGIMWGLKNGAKGLIWPAVLAWWLSVGQPDHPPAYQHE